MLLLTYLLTYLHMDQFFYTSSVGRRLSPVAASILWNSLTPDIQSSSSFADVYERLKSYLLQQSFPSILF